MTIRLTRELVSGTTDKGSIAIATPDAVTRRRARALAFLLEAAGANVDLGEFAEAELAQPLPPEAASPKII